MCKDLEVGRDLACRALLCSALNVKRVTSGTNGSDSLHVPLSSQRDLNHARRELERLGSCNRE